MKGEKSRVSAGSSPERCSKLGVCRVGVGAGHACSGAMPSSRDDLRLRVPSDGDRGTSDRRLRHPSTCTEDDDDAPPPSSALEEDDEVPAPSVASAFRRLTHPGGLNQFAMIRLMKAWG